MFNVTNFDNFDDIQHVMLVDANITKDPSDFDYFGGVGYVRVPGGNGGFFAGSILTSIDGGGFEGTFFCVNDEALLLSTDDCKTMTLRLAATGTEYDMAGAYSKAWLEEWRCIHWNTLYDLQVTWSTFNKTGYLHFDLEKLDALEKDTAHRLPYFEYLDQHWPRLRGLFDKYGIPHTYAWLPSFEKKLKRNRGLYGM